MANTDKERLKALEKIRTFKLKLPADWKFNREEANARIGQNVSAVPLPETPSPRLHS
jgi:hypothetical protein